MASRVRVTDEPAGAEPQVLAGASETVDESSEERAVRERGALPPGRVERCRKVLVPLLKNGVFMDPASSSSSENFRVKLVVREIASASDPSRARSGIATRCSVRPSSITITIIIIIIVVVAITITITIIIIAIIIISTGIPPPPSSSPYIAIIQPHRHHPHRRTGIPSRRQLPHISPRPMLATTVTGYNPLTIPAQMRQEDQEECSWEFAGTDRRTDKKLEQKAPLLVFNYEPPEARPPT
jgi:hypothetical protein